MPKIRQTKEKNKKVITDKSKIGAVLQDEMQSLKLSNSSAFSNKTIVLQYSKKQSNTQWCISENIKDC